MLRLRQTKLLGIITLALFLAGGTWFWNSGWIASDPEASFQRGLIALKSRNVVALHREIEILKRFPLYLHQMQLLKVIK